MVAGSDSSTNFYAFFSAGPLSSSAAIVQIGLLTGPENLLTVACKVLIGQNIFAARGSIVQVKRSNDKHAVVPVQPVP